ncbi:mitochondrial ribosomal small subunit component [Coelomomyces lativittatus]|nr:mitochondrial ribosomal small subunit component [Coelomomyces lativittatus]
MRLTSILFSRSAWRGPMVVHFPTLSHALSTGEPIQTDQRSATILPNYVGVKFLVHNGQNYIPVAINEDMIGHKLGEFAPSKKFVGFKSSQKKKK